MDKNNVVNDEHETLKNQIKGWGIFLLLLLATCGAAGVGQYFPQILVGTAIFACSFKLYQIKKNKKVEAAK